MENAMSNKKCRPRDQAKGGTKEFVCEKDNLDYIIKQKCKKIK